jgi:hypothetical protein
VPQKLIPANLPLYFECLCVPVEWRQVTKLNAAKLTTRQRKNLDKTVPLSSPITGPARLRDPKELDEDLLKVRVLTNKLGFTLPPTSFDPWEKRGEFFALKMDDSKGLLAFLNAVGVFQSDEGDTISVRVDKAMSSQVTYPEFVSAADIWDARRAVEVSLQKGLGSPEIGDYVDFQVRLTRHRGEPRGVLTTTTFMDALLLTLTVDRVLDAKVQKCARADCGVLFAVSGGHERKYCDRYCAHIESVRRDRERKKQQLQSSKGKGNL